MNRFEDLDDAQTAAIVDSINHKRYYLLLGSGVSLDSQGMQGGMLSANDLRKKINAELDMGDGVTLPQGVSLLDDEQKNRLLTEHYSCKVAGESISRIAARPWRRCYTLNIDNCLETAFRKFSIEHGFEPSSLEALNFDSDYTDIRPETRCSIVHLHGSVERPSSNYIFSHTEYAKIMARPNAWMTTLSHLIKSDPFIISGTTLEEIDVTYYLEQRTSSNTRSDVAQSILVEPYPNRLTELLCDNHGFTLFEGTSNDFLDRIEELSEGQNIDFWADRASARLQLAKFERADRLSFLSNFENVPSDPPIKNNAAGFLLGGVLDWSALEQDIDIPRDYSIDARALIKKKALGRIILFVDEPGAGKTSFLRRLSFDLTKSNPNVFWYQSGVAMEARKCAEMFDSMPEDCFLFVDDWADHVSFFMRMLTHLQKSNFTIIASERSYRIPYLESSMSDEDYTLVNSPLVTSNNEVDFLLQKLNQEGFSNLGRQTAGSRHNTAAIYSGEPIGIISCRIRNNYASFDKIVDTLIAEASPEAYRAFLVCALSRYCHSAGIRKSILLNICTYEGIEECLGEDASLPIIKVTGNNDFVVPKLAIIGDRVLEKASKNSPQILAGVFADLAKSIAPYVTVQTTKNRSHEARLSSRLLDYDGVVKKFIDNYAEDLYSNIKSDWDWTARYWEQLALLKLERFFADKSDIGLLNQSIQHARFAMSREYHPFSLTTLAKLLFEALSANVGDKDAIFEEGWTLICDSIRIEQRWDNVKASAFMVCFNGVINYVQSGGLLKGSQTNELQDIIATTYARKFNDRRLADAREKVKELVSV